MNIKIGALVLLVLLVLVTGCGGGGSTVTNAIEVSIFPMTANIDQGGTQSFTSPIAVNWSVQEGTVGGTISSLGVYAAPNKAGAFHVIATSQVDTTKSATATVIINAVVISLGQTAVALDVGNQFLFVAKVTGAVNKNVSWAIQEGPSGGSITSAGLYTAPGTFGAFHVIATSQADATKTQMATVTVASLVVSILPTSNVLGPLGVSDFSANVNNSLNPNVTWSVQEGATGGAIKASGQTAVYTAPNTTTGLFHVVATSVLEPTQNGIASVSIVSSGFQPTGVMGSGRSALTTTLLQSGKVLIAGGDECLFSNYSFYYSDCPLSSAELYDAGTGTFAATGNMSVNRDFHTATLLTNGKVLITGGHDATAELYDPTAGVFAATGSMSVGRSSHTATLLQNGKVLIAGGNNVSGALSTAELYDPNSGNFTATGSMAASRTSHTASLLANGKVLIAGGSNSAGELFTAELYDPTTGNFTATGNMVSKRAFHAATLLSTGNVLLTGGSVNKIVLSTTEIYDVAAGSFSATGPLMTARDSHIAILLANGTVLVAGGSYFTAELYDSVSRTFTQTGSMEITRALPGAVLLKDGRVLVSGGSDLNSAELFK